MSRIQVDDAFLGEIRIFAGNFAPTGWAFCNGQLMPIVHNTALFSLLGTTYGGDGKTNFALPNLQASAPMQQGEGPGLTHRTQGQTVGAHTVTLQASQIPAHTHQANSADRVGNTHQPQNAVWAQAPFQGKIFQSQTPVYSSSTDAQMNVAALSTAGMGQPHNNMQPYLGLNFIIAIGENFIFPPRS